MFYRTVVIFIWAFWAVMVSLLVRSEYLSKEASLYRIPVAYAASRIFTSDTGSDLIVSYKQTRVGRISIEPAPTFAKVLRGSVQVSWPVLGNIVHADIAFEFSFDSKLQPDKFKITARNDQAVIDLEGDRSKDVITARIDSGGGKWERVYPWKQLEEGKMENMLPELQQWGAPQIPSSTLAQASARLQWRASNATLKRDGRRFDALLIETEGNPDTWVKIWMTPTGEVIMVETSPTIGLSVQNPALLEPAT